MKKLTHKEAILNNDFLSLEEIASDLNIFSFTQLISKTIVLCRKDSFMFLYDYSKKFINDINYESTFVHTILCNSAYQNVFYIVKLLIENHREEISNQTYINALQAAEKHQRILSLILDNNQFTENQNYTILCSLLLNSKAQKLNQINNRVALLMKHINFNSKSFSLYLKETNNYKRSEYLAQYTADINFVDFLKMYDTDKHYLDNPNLFYDFFLSNEKEEYNQLRIKHKVHSF